MSPKLPFALAFVCLARLALADGDCARLPPSSVSLRLLEAPVATSQQYGYKALKGMSADYARHNAEVLGLTVGQANSKVAVRTTLLLDPSGRWECASHQLTVEYGFSPLTVYVGKEFPAGSCAYGEIYEHEQKHVRAYREHARRIEAEISAALRDRYEGAPPTRGPAGESRQRLQREIDERWLPYIRRLLETVQAEQREIDSKEEYERVAASCGGAIRQQISAGRR